MFLTLEPEEPEKKKKKKPANKKSTRPERDLSMENNDFYHLRPLKRRDRIFKTPDDLWRACCEYFQYVKENPLKEQRVYVTKKGLRYADLNKRRAMTYKGMYVRLGITEATYWHYKKRPEYKWVVDTVDNIIYSQKFEGAAAGMLNPNIIARDLGLVDKSQIESDVTYTKKNFNDFYNDDK